MTFTPPKNTGFVTGLMAEAAHLERVSSSTFCSGGHPGRAAEGAQQLVDMGAMGLVSFGVCGGLDPSLAPGSLIVATMVITPEGEKIMTDTAWRNHIMKLTPGPLTIAGIAGSDHAVTSPQAKGDLFVATGAAAVDMESHAVARVAIKSGVPFLVLRAIADPAHRAVPVSAMGGLGPDGHTRVLPVLGNLLLRPWELPDLLRLGWDMQKGLRALRRVADSRLSFF